MPVCLTRSSLRERVVAQPIARGARTQRQLTGVCLVNEVAFAHEKPFAFS
jgi:hypothetical protein